jgi:hypothetical protein
MCRPIHTQHTRTHLRVSGTLTWLRLNSEMANLTAAAVINYPAKLY